MDEHPVRNPQADTEPKAFGGSSRPRVFINYRHADGGWARLLYDRLADRFGAENVFLDAVSLKPGIKWLDELRVRSSACTAFIALIGPNWAPMMIERSKRPEEDHARAEIERALRRDSAVRNVIPALVGDAEQPNEKDLPSLRSLYPLLHRQWKELRPSTWDEDVEALMKEIEQIDLSLPPPPSPTPSPRPPPSRVRKAEGDHWAAPPNDHHYEELVRVMVRDGSVVPVLGPGANSSDRAEQDSRWEDVDCGYLPDADELAAYLASKVEAEPDDLARISQRMSVASGHGDLYRELRRALSSGGEPSSVHRFLARFPSALHRLGLPEQHQLIVTTNYDNALERAFDEAEEPYDLAIYLASGPHKGRFVHVPHDGEPEVIEVANRYRGFPMDEYGEVNRTVIAKIHGAVDGTRGDYEWRNNYVITEDDYIEYLTDSPIESIVPQELLGKLNYSHFLFLGYTMSDWNLRVFLRRIFGQRLPNNSWAIEPHPGELDSQFWKRIGVDPCDASLDEYVAELGRHIGAATTAPGA